MFCQSAFAGNGIERMDIGLMNAINEVLATRCSSGLIIASSVEVKKLKSIPELNHGQLDWTYEIEVSVGSRGAALDEVIFLTLKKYSEFNNSFDFELVKLHPSEVCQ